MLVVLVAGPVLGVEAAALVLVLVLYDLRAVCKWCV